MRDGRRPSRHPHHDAVHAEVRSWFTTSFPEIGITVGRLAGGVLGDLGARHARLVLEVDDPAAVAATLEEARAATAGRDLVVWVDDRRRAERLDAALRAAGTASDHATTHLALTGTLDGRYLDRAGG